MTESRLALIIANDSYDDPGLSRLLAPGADAEALGAVLADPAVGSFEVTVLRNHDAQAIRVAVEDFYADRDPDDLLLLHFSCHGLKSAGGDLFLAARDTRPMRLASTAVSADFLNRAMVESRAQRSVLFLDCCYGGAFPRGMVMRAGSDARVRDAFEPLEQVGAGRGRVIVTASSAVEYAFEGEALTGGRGVKPSLFTQAVVDGLSTGEADRDGDGWVGLGELFDHVSQRVRRETPHQTPHMWAFGTQGELLIARSRVRRITPSGLPVELLEAMHSPLAATRFGVVDDLRERLLGEDLGQAYAAWLALQEMSDDDSRRVAESAQRWIAQARPAPSASQVEIGAAAVEFSLEGPPIAQVAVASSSQAWLRVDQVEGRVRVGGDPQGLAPGEHRAEVSLSSPTGEAVVAVSMLVAGSAPVVAFEKPAFEKPAFEKAGLEKPAPEPRRAAMAAPWWAACVVVACAVLLIGANWPGDGSRYAWKNSDAGWYVYRSWHDADVIGSILLLAGGLAVRWSRWAMAGVAGCAVFLASDALVYLVGGLTNGDPTWLLVLVLSVLVLLVVWPALRTVLRPVSGGIRPAALLLIIIGVVLEVISAGLGNGSTSFLQVSRNAAVLGPLALAAMAVLSVWAAEVAARRLFATATAVCAGLSLIGSYPALDVGMTSSFWVAVFGYLILLSGPVVAVTTGAATQPIPPIPRESPE